MALTNSGGFWLDTEINIGKVFTVSNIKGKTTPEGDTTSGHDSGGIIGMIGANPQHGVQDIASIEFGPTYWLDQVMDGTEGGRTVNPSLIGSNSMVQSGASDPFSGVTKQDSNNIKALTEAEFKSDMSPLGEFFEYKDGYSFPTFKTFAKEAQAGFAIRPSLATLSITPESDSSVTINATVNSNNLDTNVSFEFDTNSSFDNPSNANHGVISGSTTGDQNVSKLLTDINKTKEYYFRTKVVYNGTTAYSNVIGPKSIIGLALDTIKAYADDENKTAPSLAVYSLASIDNVSSGLLDAINDSIADGNSSDVNTTSKIQAIVDKVIAAQVIKNYADDNNNTTPSTTNYVNAGVSDVNSTNLDAINDAIDGKAGAQADTPSEIQAVVDGYNKIINYTTSTAVAPTYMDYTNIGVTEIDSEELANALNELVNAQNGISDVDTVAKIQALADKVIAFNIIEKYADDDNNTKPVEDTFVDANVSDVNSSNIDEINSVIASKTSGDVNTTAKVQDIVDMVNGINVIEGYADNNNNTTPVVNDYVKANVTDVNNTNVNDINIIVDKLGANDVNTTAKIQALVDGHNISESNLTAYANSNGSSGAPSIDIYSNFGVTGVASGNIATINALIAGLNGTDIDTIPELQAIIDTQNEASVAVIQSYADDNTSTQPEVSHYLGAGISDVNSSNLAHVNKVVNALEGNDVNTSAKIQAVVDNVNALIEIQEDSASSGGDNNTNGTNVTLEQLKDIQGIQRINDSLIAQYQADIEAETNFSDIPTLSEVQAIIDRVNAQNKIVKYANDNTSVTTPVVSDYSDLNVTDVNNTNLPHINDAIDALEGNDVNTTAKVQAVVDSVNALIEIQEDSASSGGDNNTNGTNVTLEQLKDIQGIQRINDSLIAQYQADIEAETNFSDIPTLSEVQAIIDRVNAQNKIVKYANDNTSVTTPVVSDYSDLNVTDVNNTNLPHINDAIDALEGNDVNTTAKVQAVVDSVNALIEIQEDSASSGGDNNTNGTNVTLEQLKDIQGIQRINDSLIAQYQADIEAETNFSDIPTLSEVQYIIDRANNNLPVITTTPSSYVEEDKPYVYIPVITDADNDLINIEIKDGTSLPSWLRLENNKTKLADSDVPYDIAVDRATDTLYVVNHTAGTIEKITADGTKITFASGLNNPIGIHLANNGELYVTEYDGQSVKKVSSDGNTITPIKDLGSRPSGIVVDENGVMYISDFDGDKVIKVEANGTISDFATGMDNPEGIVIDNNGNLYVAAVRDDAIYKIAPDGTKTTFVSGLKNPVGLEIDNNFLYIGEHEETSSNTATVKKIKLDDNTSMETIANSGLNSVRGLAIGSNGTVYVSDYGNNKIEKITKQLVGTPSNSDIGSYDINLTISDKYKTIEQNFKLEVREVNVAPTFVTSSSISSNENNKTVVNLNATDSNGDAISYTIAGGVDAALFDINSSSGKLEFKVAPDFENPSDSDGNNTYVVDVNISDAYGGSSIQTFTISIDDVVESANFSLNNITSSNIQEGIPFISSTPSVLGETPIGSLRYSISGDDASKFEINATTGVLTMGAKEYNATDDTDTNNVYDVTVTVTDSDGNSDSEDISVTITKAIDTDGDGLLNNVDTDDDNDGIPDSVEGSVDSDGDGLIDALDRDSDNDGILDTDESVIDTDGDGIPNYKDTDSDGDSLLDKDEGTGDSDGDGILNYLDNKEDRFLDNGTGTQTLNVNKIDTSTTNDKSNTNITIDSGVPNDINFDNNQTNVSLDSLGIELNITKEGGVTIDNSKNKITIANSGADINISSNKNIHISTPAYTNPDGLTCEYDINVIYDDDKIITEHILGTDPKIVTTIENYIANSSLDINKFNTVKHISQTQNEDGDDVNVTTFVNCDGSITTATKLSDFNATLVTVNKPGSKVIIHPNGDVNTTTSFEQNTSDENILNALNFVVDSKDGNVTISEAYQDKTTKQVSYQEVSQYLAGTKLKVNGNHIATVDITLAPRLIKVNVKDTGDNNITTTTNIDSSIANNTFDTNTDSSTGIVKTTTTIGDANLSIDNLVDGKVELAIEKNGKKTQAKILLEGSDTNITSSGIVSTFEDDSGVIVAVETTTDGKVTHKVELNGKVTEANSAIIGSTTVLDSDDSGNPKVVTSASIDNNNSKAIDIVVEALSDGTATHKLEIDGLITEATSQIDGAKTTIKEDGEVETNSTLPSGAIAKVIARPDGKAIHIISDGSSYKTQASSDIVGAKTTIIANGVTETIADVKTNECGTASTYKKAIALTDDEGKSTTKFVEYDCTNNNEVQTFDTFSDSSTFNPDNNITIFEESGEIFIKTIAPFTQNQEVNF
jgi:hypothetical protein